MLPSYLLKFAWAEEQLKALLGELNWWVASEPYRITEDFDSDSGATTLSAEPFGNPPLDLAPRIGDFVHNLRTGLDHLVLALAERNRGGPLSDKEEQASQFPIYSTRKKWKSGYKNRIGCVHPKAQAALKRLQPYRLSLDWELAQRRGDRARGSGQEWRDHPLWRLREISDFDKHRRLSLVTMAAALNASIPSVPGHRVETGSIYVHTTGGALEGKTPLLTWEDSIDLDTGAKVEMNRQVTVYVGFGEQSPSEVTGRAVAKELSSLFEYVAVEVRPALEPFLE